MRVSCLAVVLGLAGVVFASCSDDKCLRAVGGGPSRSVISDCESLFKVTVTPATSTILHTIAATTSGTITRTTTAEASKRWEDQHEALSILLRRGHLAHTTTTSPAQSTPAYASVCSSLVAYSSACSCLGVTHVTITASTPKTTETVIKVATVVTTEIFAITGNSSVHFKNSTSARFGNSTTVASNATSSKNLLFSDSSDSPSASLSSGISPGTSESYTSIKTGRIHSITSSPNRLSSGVTSASSDSNGIITKIILVTHTTSLGKFVNTSTAKPFFSNTTAPFLNVTGTEAKNNSIGISHLLNTTTPIITLGANTTGRFLNATTGTLKALNTTATAPFLNATTANLLAATVSAPFLNFTSAHFLNTSRSAPFLNTTRLQALNATKAAFANTTTSAPFLNTTSIPLLNTTRAPFANTTSRPFSNSTAVRFSNTSTPTATPTSTATLDLTCGETTPPFLLQVSQPSSFFDGWYLKMSGNAILFNPSANQSSKFSVESSGHLCAVGYLGQSGKPAIAIAETKEDLTGSAIYFVDGERVANITPRGYGPLDCAVNDDLACQANGMSHWVGCGLGLDISSDAGQQVVVDSWNCTSIGLSAVYA